MAKPLRLNEQIRISPIRLIDDRGEQRGVVSTDEALGMARDLGLDLVEISPMERPPVCRIMDYGKHRYDQKKKQKQKPSHVAVLKEVRLRPKTDPHDRSIKINHAREFLKEGSKVMFTMLFKGRERAHQEVGLKIFRSIVEELGDEVKVERNPMQEGRRLTMIVVAGKPAKPNKPVKPAAKPATSVPAAGPTEPESLAVTQPVGAAPPLEAQETQAAS